MPMAWWAVTPSMLGLVHAIQAVPPSFHLLIQILLHIASRPSSALFSLSQPSGQQNATTPNLIFGWLLLQGSQPALSCCTVLHRCVCLWTLWTMQYWVPSVSPLTRSGLSRLPGQLGDVEQLGESTWVSNALSRLYLWTPELKPCDGPVWSPPDHFARLASPNKSFRNLEDKSTGQMSPSVPSEGCSVSLDCWILPGWK